MQIILYIYIYHAIENTANQNAGKQIESTLNDTPVGVTNHKTLVDVTASLDRNCLSFTKEKVY